MRVQTSLNIQNKKSIPLERGDPGVENIIRKKDKTPKKGPIKKKKEMLCPPSAPIDKPRLRVRVQKSKNSDLKIINKNSKKENKHKQHIYNTRSVNKVVSKKLLEPKHERNKIYYSRSVKKQKFDKKKLKLNDCWIPITPQMLMHVFYESDSELKISEISFKLRKSYPVQPVRKELLKELRLKLQSANEIGLLHRYSGSIFSKCHLKSLRKKIIQQFWDTYHVKKINKQMYQN